MRLGCAQKLKTPQGSICEEPQSWSDNAGPPAALPAPRPPGPPATLPAPRPRPLHPEGPRTKSLAGQEDPHLCLADQGGLGGAREEGEVVAGVTPPPGQGELRVRDGGGHGDGQGELGAGAAAQELVDNIHP